MPPPLTSEQRATTLMKVTQQLESWLNRSDCQEVAKKLEELAYNTSSTSPEYFRAIATKLKKVHQKSQENQQQQRKQAMMHVGAPMLQAQTHQSGAMQFHGRNSMQTQQQQMVFQHNDNQQAAMQHQQQPQMLPQSHPMQPVSGAVPSPSANVGEAFDDFSDMAAVFLGGGEPPPAPETAQMAQPGGQMNPQMVDQSAQYGALQQQCPGGMTQAKQGAVPPGHVPGPSGMQPVTNAPNQGVQMPTGNFPSAGNSMGAQNVAAMRAGSTQMHNQMRVQQAMPAMQAARMGSAGAGRGVAQGVMQHSMQKGTMNMPMSMAMVNTSDGMSVGQSPLDQSMPQNNSMQAVQLGAAGQSMFANAHTSEALAEKYWHFHTQLKTSYIKMLHDAAVYYKNLKKRDPNNAKLAQVQQLVACLPVLQTDRASSRPVNELDYRRLQKIGQLLQGYAARMKKSRAQGAGAASTVSTLTAVQPEQASNRLGQGTPGEQPLGMAQQIRPSMNFAPGVSMSQQQVQQAQQAASQQQQQAAMRFDGHTAAMSPAINTSGAVSTPPMLAATTPPMSGGSFQELHGMGSGLGPPDSSLTASPSIAPSGGLVHAIPADPAQRVMSLLKHSNFSDQHASLFNEVRRGNWKSNMLLPPSPLTYPMSPTSAFSSSSESSPVFNAHVACDIYAEGWNNRHMSQSCGTAYAVPAVPDDAELHAMASAFAE